MAADGRAGARAAGEPFPEGWGRGRVRGVWRKDAVLPLGTEIKGVEGARRSRAATAASTAAAADGGLSLPNESLQRNVASLETGGVRRVAGTGDGAALRGTVADPAHGTTARAACGSSGEKS